MDAYFRKTRRLTGDLSSSHKGSSISRKLNFDQPAPAVTPKATTTRLTTTTTSTTTTTTSTTTTKPSTPKNKDGAKSRPTTPSDARLPRPIAPPPVKRKLTPEDIKQTRRKRRPTSVRELFKSVHPHEEASPIKAANSELKCPQDTEDLGLKRLEIPQVLATPPATPIKTPVKSAALRLLGPVVPTTSTSSIIKSPTKLQPESPSKIASGPLRGVSTTLLDLIRAKETAAKKITPEQFRRKELLGIAPELVRIVCTIFTANKKEIMLYNTVVEKCSKGLKNHYTTSTIMECLDLMMKIAPEWVTIVEISRGKFIRWNKSQYSLHQLLKAIQKYSDAHSINA